MKEGIKKNDTRSKWADERECWSEVVGRGFISRYWRLLDRRWAARARCSALHIHGDQWQPSAPDAAYTYPAGGDFLGLYGSDPTGTGPIIIDGEACYRERGGAMLETWKLC